MFALRLAAHQMRAQRDHPPDPLFDGAVTGSEPAPRLDVTRFEFFQSVIEND
jgi:hypothetical protein